MNTPQPALQISDAYSLRRAKILYWSLFLLLSLLHIGAILLIPAVAVLLATLTSFSLVSITMRNAYKRLSKASISGDTLILRSENNQHYVTPIRNIRSIRSKRLGRTLLTSIDFKTDGRLTKATIVSSAEQTNQPESLIRSMRKEKNKKANL